MMTRRTRSTLLCTLGLFTGASAAALSTSCSQPPMNCSSAHGKYAAQYTLTEGDPDSTCAQLVGDVLGMQTYHQAGGQNGTPNYQDARVAIRPQSLGELIAHAEAHADVDEQLFYDANALGDFGDGFPDDDGFCMVDEFEPAEVSLPEVGEVYDDPETEDEDESTPARPATDIAYLWSNARFVVTPDAQGTQFEADLDYRQDGCEASYHVVGLYRVVECEDDDACNDDQNGINPDFAVRCNIALGLCVLDGELPAYE